MVLRWHLVYPFQLTPINYLRLRLTFSYTAWFRTRTSFNAVSLFLLTVVDQANRYQLVTKLQAYE